MSSKHGLVTVFTVLFLIISSPVLAGAKGLEAITPLNFDATHQQVQTQIKDIQDKVGKIGIRKYKEKDGHARSKLTPRQAQYKDEYLKLLAQEQNLGPVQELRQALQKTYLDQNKNEIVDTQRLHEETTFLALGLINEIADLKEKYRSIFIPIFHNMMIDVGVRQRGACKHWAEDLLIHLRPKDRHFFDVTWGQANAGKFTEHNVAVLIPKGKGFDTGLIIDPWRTSGKPFWVRTTGDAHYHWEAWAEYGIY